MNYDIEAMVVMPYINSNTEQAIRDEVFSNVVNNECNFSKVYYLLSKNYPSRSSLIDLLTSDMFIHNLINKIQGGF